MFSPLINYTLKLPSPCQDTIRTPEERKHGERDSYRNRGVLQIVWVGALPPTPESKG